MLGLPETAHPEQGRRGGMTKRKIKDFETLNTLADAVARRRHGLAPAAKAGP